MKHFLAFCFVWCISGFPLLAQNWQCMQPGRKVYFTNAEHYLHGMRIDSVRTSAGGNTLFYPYRSPRGSFAKQFPILDSTKGSWLGALIETDASGKTSVYTYWNDTLVIETKAGLGASWVFYSDTTPVYYRASVSKLDTMIIGGVLDSIKRIDLAAYTSGSIIASHPVNKLHLTLSKNHGFEEVPDLYMFPYHRIDSPTLNQFDWLFRQVYTSSPDSAKLMFRQTDFGNPTTTALYALQPGDKYQTRKITLKPGITELVTDSIVSRTLSANVLSLGVHSRKTTLDWPMANPPMLTYTVSYSNSVRTYAVGTAMLIDTVRMPEEWGTNSFHRYNRDDTSFCLRSPSYSIAPNFIANSGKLNNFEPCGTSNSYKVGLGLVDSNVCFDPYPNLENFSLSVSYARIGSTPCGQWSSLAAASISPSVPDAMLTPNPADKEFFLNFPAASESEIQVFDALGHSKYHVKNAPGSSLKIDTQYWPSGIYYIVLRNAALTQTLKLIVQH
jgi:hypothetical protein